MKKKTQSEIVKTADGTWTQFWDMNSGGGVKHEYSMIYIQAPEEQAESIFYSKFDTNPNRVSCTCCGSDYSIRQGTLKELTAYHRGLRSVEEIRATKRYPQQQYLEPDEEIPEGYKLHRYNYNKTLGLTLEEYMDSPETKFIFEDEIQDHERSAYVPEEGYVWR